MILARPRGDLFRLADEGASLATGTGVQSMTGGRGSQFLNNRANARNLERVKLFAKYRGGAIQLCAV
jgi:hypothetical protein